MASGERDLIEAVISEAVRLGGRKVDVIRQKKHPAVAFEVDTPNGIAQVIVGMRGRPCKSCRAYVASYENAVRKHVRRAKGA